MPAQLKYLTSETPIEERIALLLGDRDRTAVSLIYQNYASILLNVILRVVKYDDVAKDVLQDALLKIWRNSTNFDASKGSLFTWLVRVCRNAAIDKTRSKDFKQRQKSEQAVDLVFVSDTIGNESEIYDHSVRELMSQLPEKQRMLINMSFFEGYSHPEISERLSIPLGTVKTRIRMALQHLRSIV
ncbi:RNA polymerase sigma factor [Roseivirga echinicomitans]